MKLADVTLACEDGKQLEAHKVILAISIPVFQKIFTRNKHVHPFLYMRGMKSDVLSAVLDFLYCGETNVNQGDLDSFLAIAEELRLKGLMGKLNQDEEITTMLEELPVTKDETRMTKSSAISSPRGTSRDSLAQAVALANEDWQHAKT